MSNGVWLLQVFVIAGPPDRSLSVVDFFLTCQIESVHMR